MCTGLARRDGKCGTLAEHSWGSVRCVQPIYKFVYSPEMEEWMNFERERLEPTVKRCLQ